MQRELLLLAHKIKGPDRLALVTDCNRALDLHARHSIPIPGESSFCRLFALLSLIFTTAEHRRIHLPIFTARPMCLSYASSKLQNPVK